VKTAVTPFKRDASNADGIAAPASRARSGRLAGGDTAGLVDGIAGNEFKAVIPRPLTDQVTGQVTNPISEEVARLWVTVAAGEQARRALQPALGLKHTPHFRKNHRIPALEAGHLEMTLPETTPTAACRVTA